MALGNASRSQSSLPALVARRASAKGVRTGRRVTKMMFERFTEKAIKVVMLAQEEARRLGHNFVGTEQILLGLIGESTGTLWCFLYFYPYSVEGYTRKGGWCILA